MWSQKCRAQETKMFSRKCEEMYIEEKLFYKVFTLFVKLKAEYYSFLYSLVISSLLQFVYTKAIQEVLFHPICYFCAYFCVTSF